MTQAACADYIEKWDFRGIFCGFRDQEYPPGNDGPDSDLLWRDPRECSKTGKVGQGREGDEARAQYPVTFHVGTLWLDLTEGFGGNVITSESCPSQGWGSWGIYIPHVVRATLEGSFWCPLPMGRSGSLGTALKWTERPHTGSGSG